MIMPRVSAYPIIKTLRFANEHVARTLVASRMIVMGRSWTFLSPTHLAGRCWMPQASAVPPGTWRRLRWVRCDPLHSIPLPTQDVISLPRRRKLHRTIPSYYLPELSKTLIDTISKPKTLNLAPRSRSAPRGYLHASLPSSSTSMRHKLHSAVQSISRRCHWTIVATRIRRRRLIRIGLVVALFPILLQWLLAYILGSDARLLPPELLGAKNLLIVTAHPDDECLFFAPSILGVLDRNHGINGGLVVMSAG